MLHLSYTPYYSMALVKNFSNYEATALSRIITTAHTMGNRVLIEV